MPNLSSLTPDDTLYWYRLKSVFSNHDGDTAWLELDVGFRLAATVPLRLTGIDAPELGSEGALVSRDYLRSRLDTAIEDGLPAMVRTYKTEKYGRWLSTIYVGSECINDTMLSLGLARPYNGGKR